MKLFSHIRQVCAVVPCATPGSVAVFALVDPLGLFSVASHLVVFICMLLAYWLLLAIQHDKHSLAQQ